MHSVTINSRIMLLTEMILSTENVIETNKIKEKIEI